AAPEQRTSEPPTSRDAIQQQMIRAAIEEYVDRVVAPAIGESIARLMRESERSLTAKLTPLIPRFAGTWAGKQHRANEFVAHGGSSFVCVADTNTKPGTSTSWVPLAIRGRDGKDGAPPPEPPAPRTVRTQR